MKLYYSPGACSLSDHIALHEAGLVFDRIKVDLRTKTTESGEDFLAVNPKGYVPALTLDSGETISENIAVLSWIAEQAPRLSPQGALGRTRLLEALAYIAGELHKNFKPYLTPGASEDLKRAAGETITKRLALMAEQVGDDYLFGAEMSVADAYLFVMLLWARKDGISIPDPLPAFVDRMMARDSVRTAMQHEGLI